MGIKNVSLKTIASECGVSIMTVSRALRDSDEISEETKKKIRQLALELGYMPNHVAQSMRKDEKPVIAILIDDYTNLYYNAFMNELMTLVKEKNEYDFEIIYFKNFDAEVVKQCILQRVDLIVTHVIPTQKVYELINVNKIQTIIVGSCNSNFDIDVVSIDNEMGSILAARYLRNFHNCNKYIYIGVDYFLSDKRRECFIDELNKIHDGEYDIKTFYADKEPIKKLYKYIVDGYRNIFIYNDGFAYRILNLLDNIALDIRRTFPDLHLVGFDGLCEYFPGMKQITTIKINYSEFANATYEVIHNRMEKRNYPKQNIILPVSLHQRKIIKND